MKKLYEEIVERVGVGIHAVDREGKTIIYNNKMRDMEAMDKEDVLHKDVREVFKFQENQSSTLLKSLEHGEEIVNVKQTYFNNKGVEITTVNHTFPLVLDNKIYAAVELSTDVTKMERLMRQKRTQTKTDFTFEHIIGNSNEIREVISLAKRATRTNSSVLIIGETGTGKELFAQSIHAESERANAPFITQNCAALPDSLIEGILFGTTKGAFTGAIDSPGLFEQAQGGTLLLDELNSLNIALQAKLLRVLQERKVRRIGGTQEIAIDVRVIATVNEDPIDAVANNRLRKDLYYRLAVVTLFIPPLRERVGDIPLLVDEFIQKYNQLFKLNVKGVSDEVKEFFETQSWPGNIRELEHVIEASMNLINYEQIIEFYHLPYQYRKKIDVNQTVVTPDFAVVSTIDNQTNLSDQLTHFEKKLIEHYLQLHKNHITNTAAALGISRQSLQYRMKRLDIYVK
ncbi:PAS domain S-box protein [Lysinibacillus composti]|uniref:PAS domain S-box protein n=1 Tax=Lysinibacillus composti TaxID=720633 RepID=A0A3N9U780_9BACI|nr:sigma 54-interacting transcriptional regulator [Lysinibacillus composti]RQW72410.1 PAS domain S-box protein [Lysinibacillus composti]